MNSPGRSGMAALIKIAFRNLFRNTRRTAFCVAAVGIAVFFIVFYKSFIDGMTRNIGDVAQTFDLGHVRVVSAQYEAENEYNPTQYPVSDGADWRKLAASIKTIPGAREVFPRIFSYATLQESSVKHAVLWGIRIAEETTFHDFNLTGRDSGLREGRWPAPDANECAVGSRFAERTGLAIGDRLPLKTMSAQFSGKMWNPRIVGIFNFDYAKFDRETILVDFDRLQRLLTLGEGTQQLLIYAEKEEQSAALAQAVQTLLGPDDTARQWRDNYWVAVMDSVKPLYTAMFFIFLIVACCLIVNTITMIIHERIKEIGMMGSLGMTRAQIVLVFFFESFFLAVFGASAGTLLGGTLTGILQFFPLRWGDMTGGAYTAFPANGALFLSFSARGLIQGWLMGVAVTSAFTLIPSLKSAFVEPVEALRR